MNLITTFTATLLATRAVQAAAAQTVSFGDDVKVVPIKEALSEFSKDSDAVNVLMVYSESCQHCHNFASVLSRTTADLKTEFPNLNIMATALSNSGDPEETQFMQTLAIKQYPSLRVNYMGQILGDAVLQHSPVDADWIKNVRKLFADVWTAVPSVDTEADDFNFGVFTYVGPTSTPVFDLLKTIASAKRNIMTYRYVEDASADPTITIKHQFEEPIVKTLDAAVDKHDVENFIDGNMCPLFGRINVENYMIHPLTERSTVFFITTEAQFEALHPVLKEKLPSVSENFHHSYINHQTMPSQATQIANQREFPVAVANVAREKFFYQFKDVESFDADDYLSWLNKVQKGEIAYVPKSQPIPEKDPEAPILTVVGADFGEAVAESEKYVFIKAYAPWCGACKNMAADWVALGDFISSDASLKERITIAEIDASANELTPSSKFGITHFPTLILHKKGMDTPVRYEGNRSFTEMKKWLLEQTSSDAGAEVIDDL